MHLQWIRWRTAEGCPATSANLHQRAVRAGHAKSTIRAGTFLFQSQGRLSSSFIILDRRLCIQMYQWKSVNGVQAPALFVIKAVPPRSQPWYMHMFLTFPLRFSLAIQGSIDLKWLSSLTPAARVSSDIYHTIRLHDWGKQCLEVSSPQPSRKKCMSLKIVYPLSNTV